MGQGKSKQNNVASGWIVIYRFFMNMGWNMTGLTSYSIDKGLTFLLVTVPE
jgi:hypothetical protein